MLKPDVPENTHPSSSIVTEKAVDILGGVTRTHLPIALGECTEEDVKLFFEEEFPALVFASVAQCLVGFEVDSVDFKKRRIYFRESRIVISEEDKVESVDETKTKKSVDMLCSTCSYLSTDVSGPSGSLLCKMHGYTTQLNDTCPQWEVNPTLLETADD
jgi:hypothetical protein